MDINERFKVIINSIYKGNQSAFAKAIGVTPTVIANVVGSRQGKPSFDVISKICANANISADWLLTGKGSMLKNESPAGKQNASNTTVSNDKIIKNKSDNQESSPKLSSDSPSSSFSSPDDLPADFSLVSAPTPADAKAIPFATANKQGLKPIPLVTQQVAAGFGSADFAIGEKDVKAYYVIPKFRFLNVDFMIEVTGVSMMPKYNPGDIVACTIIRNSRFIQWNRPHVVALTEQGLVIKRLRQATSEDSLTFVSDNNDYAPFDVPKDEITGIALVVGHVGLD